MTKLLLARKPPRCTSKCIRPSVLGRLTFAAQAQDGPRAGWLFLPPVEQDRDSVLGQDDGA